MGSCCHMVSHNKRMPFVILQAVLCMLIICKMYNSVSIYRHGWNQFANLMIMSNNHYSTISILCLFYEVKNSGFWLLD
jgi:hypothetical protein